MDATALRICDLRQKEVINIRDCQRLGYVADIDFDVCTGCICQLIVPGPAKFCGFFGREIEYTIGWRCVKQIGDDVILVDIDTAKTCKKCAEKD